MSDQEVSERQERAIKLLEDTLAGIKSGNYLVYYIADKATPGTPESPVLIEINLTAMVVK